MLCDLLAREGKYFKNFVCSHPQHYLCNKCDYALEHDVCISAHDVAALPLTLGECAVVPEGLRYPCCWTCGCILFNVSALDNGIK